MWREFTPMGRSTQDLLSEIADPPFTPLGRGWWSNLNRRFHVVKPSPEKWFVFIDERNEG